MITLNQGDEKSMNNFVFINLTLPTQELETAMSVVTSKQRKLKINLITVDMSYCEGEVLSDNDFVTIEKVLNSDLIKDSISKIMINGEKNHYIQLVERLTNNYSHLKIRFAIGDDVFELYGE